MVSNCQQNQQLITIQKDCNLAVFFYAQNGYVLYIKNIAFLLRAIVIVSTGYQQTVGLVIYYFVMIVAKFGGTAITAENIFKVKSLVTNRHKVVVVSAIGKSFFGDTKATDLLLKYQQTGQGHFLHQVANKYQQLANVANAPFDKELLVHLAQKYSALCPNALVSLGEYFSSQIVAGMLGAQWVDASTVVRFTDGKLNFATSCKLINRRCSGNGLYVIGGFYGADEKGNVFTFSRGGGDVTGALVSVAMGASVYQNWTDTCGVHITDPAICRSKCIPNLSYKQMHFLAKNGANVLHPTCVKMCQSRAIPIVVGNYLFPHAPSTTISNASCTLPLLNITQLVKKSHFETTVLHNMPQQDVTARLTNFFGALPGRYKILSFSVTSGVCKITSNLSIVKPLYAFVL